MLKHDFYLFLISFPLKICFTTYLTIQNAISIILRMLIPVNNPRVPPEIQKKICLYYTSLATSNSFAVLPKADILSKKLTLLLKTVTDIVSVTSLKLTSAR